MSETAAGRYTVREIAEAFAWAIYGWVAFGVLVAPVLIVLYVTGHLR